MREFFQGPGYAIIGHFDGVEKVRFETSVGNGKYKVYLERHELLKTDDIFRMYLNEDDELILELDDLFDTEYSAWIEVQKRLLLQMREVRLTLRIAQKHISDLDAGLPDKPVKPKRRVAA